MTTTPRFPVFIPSKGRATIAQTPHVLDRLGVPYRLIVEEAEAEVYAQVYGGDRVVVLDPTFTAEYDACMDVGPDDSRGPGPARNYGQHIATEEGYSHCWLIDDNVRLFARFHRNERIPVADGHPFHAMETFALRYKNVGMVGPQYWSFCNSRTKYPPYVLNKRIFSCNLVRLDTGIAWRGRWNEDLILSYDLLHAGWCTVLFNAFLQEKENTQLLSGGNTDEFYAREGTLRKSQMAVAVYPELVRLVERYGRWHHVADFKPFRDEPRLLFREDYDPDAEPEYRTVKRPERGGVITPGLARKMGEAALDGPDA